MGGLSDPEKFTFTYKMREETYELYDEQQILYPPSLLPPLSLCLSLPPSLPPSLPFFSFSLPPSLLLSPSLPPTLPLALSLSLSLPPSFLNSVASQTAAVVQLWRKERFEKGFLVVEQKKAESKEVGVAMTSFCSNYYVTDVTIQWLGEDHEHGDECHDRHRSVPAAVRQQR